MTESIINNISAMVIVLSFITLYRLTTSINSHNSLADGSDV